MFLLLVLLIAGVTTFNSHGFYHPDEHWQILEYANFKAGNITADNLPWEYSHQIRQTIQPSFVCGMLVAGLPPFTLALLLRVVSLLAAVFVFWMCYKVVVTHHFPTASLFVLVLCSFWFLPFLCVRFTSENWSGIFLSAAVFYILMKDGLRGISSCVVAGLLMGMAFIFRYQSALAIAGIAMWFIFVTRMKPAFLVAIFLSGLMVACLGVLIDYWFYGRWVLTAWNYFYTTLLQTDAPDFGSSPWYFYFVKIVTNTLIVDGILVLTAFAVLFIVNPRHILIWVIVPYLVGHILVSHKEIRFLFPLVYFVPLLCFELLARVRYKNARMMVGIMCVLNIVPMVAASMLPAASSVEAIKVAMDERSSRVKVLYTDENPVRMYWLNNNFYFDAPRNVEFIKEDIPDLGRYSNDSSAIYLYASVGELRNIPRGVSVESTGTIVPAVQRYFWEKDLPGKRYVLKLQEFNTYKVSFE